MEKIDPDTPLIDRIQSGDHSAFNLLVIKYQFKITRVVFQYVKHDNDAAGVCRKCLSMLMKNHQFRHESLFYTRLYRIAVNCAKNFLRSHEVGAASQRSEDTCIQTYGSLQDSPESLYEKKALHDTLAHAIDTLPEDLSAFKLREVDCLSYHDIATKCSALSVQSCDYLGAPVASHKLASFCHLPPLQGESLKASSHAHQLANALQDHEIEWHDMPADPEFIETLQHYAIIQAALQHELPEQVDTQLVKRLAAYTAQHAPQAMRPWTKWLQYGKSWCQRYGLQRLSIQAALTARAALL